MTALWVTIAFLLGAIVGGSLGIIIGWNLVDMAEDKNEKGVKA